MLTFEEWVETYLPRRERETPKSAKRDASYLKRAEEYFGGRALDEIETEDVQAAREEIADARGVTTANRWMSALRACFRAAVVSGIVARDPTQGLKLYNERNGRRRPRVLTDDELAAVVAEVDKLSDPFVRGAFLLLIGTGVRKGEALSARWDEIDLDLGEWRLSETKSNAAQTVYLAPAVVELLRSLPRIEGSPWVFPGNRDPERYHLPDIHYPWQEVKERIGVPDIWIHDLRRTFGDRMKRAADLQVASEALRHANISVTSSHYAPAGEERIRGTLERVVGEVIPFPSANSGE
jgi:integrase